LKVAFYGARGSTPVAEPDYTRFGGNTSCVLMTFKNGRIGILDAGTGIRKLGDDFAARSIEQYDNIFIGLSHTHWDHIQGFPFFKPAYDPRRRLTISIYREGRNTTDLEHVLTTQMQRDYFPVSLDRMGATVIFWQPEINDATTASGVNIMALKHNHTGDAYSYRITEGETSLVYSTDVEHIRGIDPKVVAFARNADLLIHDAQYTPDELRDKRGWGHSSWQQAVEVAVTAGVKKLALFHHDPEHNDAFLLKIEKECQRLFSEAFLAREGLEIEI
jgi:phosphoribosyl 1,2-cyclic phosphodiesterase